jgi:hypothetical protein
LREKCRLETVKPQSRWKDEKSHHIFQAVTKGRVGEGKAVAISTRLKFQDYSPNTNKTSKQRSKSRVCGNRPSKKLELKTSTSQRKRSKQL